MPMLDLFLPLTKVDVDQRTVHGVATAEQPDRSGEICDYDSTKPYFEAWSAHAHEASGGKSLGAVRAMHARVAAGKLVDISFDDANKQIRVAAKIVDDRRMGEGSRRRLHRLQPGRTLCEALERAGHGSDALHRRPQRNLAWLTCPACPARRSNASRRGSSKSALSPRRRTTFSTGIASAAGCGVAAASRGAAVLLPRGAGEGRARFGERGRQIGEGDRGELAPARRPSAPSRRS